MRKPAMKRAKATPKREEADDEECDHQTSEAERTLPDEGAEWLTAIRKRRASSRLRQNTDDDLLYAREFVTSLEL
jgi:hypothetical protein